MDDEKRDLAVYAVLVNRRHALDAAKWQVPSLAFAGQAFLFQIAYAGGHPRYSAIAGVLIFLIGLSAIQLLLRHSHFELQTSKWIEELEKKMSFPAHGLEIYHGKPAPKMDGFIPIDWFTNCRSRNIWILYFIVSSALGLIPFARMAWPPFFEWLCDIGAAG